MNIETRHELGSKLAEYSSPRRLYIGVFMSIISLAICFMFLTLAAGTPRSFPSDEFLSIFDSIFAFIFGLLAMLGFASAVVYRREFVRLYENGIEIEKNHAVKTVVWEQIESIRGKVRSFYSRLQIGSLITVRKYYDRTTHSYQIRLKDGREIVLDDQIREVWELGEKLEAIITKKMFPGALAALEAGERMTFGPIHISNDMLRQANGQVYGWREIENVRIRHNRLIVRRVDGFQEDEVGPYVWKIPNVQLLVDLSAQMMNVARYRKAEPVSGA